MDEYINEGDAIEFQSSKLGTKQHWEEIYQLELDNYEEFSDKGDTWYGKAIENKVISWIVKEMTSVSSRFLNLKENSCVLDIGCGNGHFLFSLDKQLRNKSLDKTKPICSLVGVDYSKYAIRLAKSISDADYEKCQGNKIKFVQMDFLSLQSTNDSECEQEKEDDSIFESIVGTKYTVLADKGTFDAISLKPESNENSNIRDKRCEKDLKLTPEPAAEVEVEDGIEGTIKIETSARIAYINSVKKLLDPGGVFVITSCNWTQNELVNIFSNDFVAVDFIKHTNFTFGGQKGQCVSSVVFKHRQWAAENSI